MKKSGSLSGGFAGTAFVHSLLHGEFFHDPDPVLADADESTMRRWYADLHGAPVLRAAMLHELQARLLRFAFRAGGVSGHAVQPEIATPGVSRMLHYIAGHFREPGLNVARITRDARLSPFYANDLFRKTCGVSLMRHVNRQRVIHAQYLLTNTDLKIIDVAFESGFGSESQFYTVFRGITGATPREYAKARGKGDFYFALSRRTPNKPGAL